MKIRVGLFGFGKTGKLVADEFIKDDNFVTDDLQLENPELKIRLSSEEKDKTNYIGVGKSKNEKYIYLYQKF